MAIHGRMYTVAAASAATNTIVAGSGIISPAELNTGDLISVYDTTGRLLGSTNVVSVASVSVPNGILSTTVDSVFQTTFSGYNYLQVKAWMALCSPVTLGPHTGLTSASAASCKCSDCHKIQPAPGH